MNRRMQTPGFGHIGTLIASCALLGAVAAPGGSIAHAQAPPPPPPVLTLSEVVQSAVRDYPLVHVTQEELNASAANIELARTSYLPRVDGLAQFNRATRNNVFGALLPQNIVPSMTGPVLGTNNGGSVWGSATGLLVNWQPFDFGVRHANVTASRAARDAASAVVQRTQLDVGTAAADAFLTLIAAQQTERSAAAAVDNWDVLLRSIHALTSAQLRPGADESRVEAERALAETQLAYAKQAEQISRATLVKFMPHADDGGIMFATARLLTESPQLAEEGVPFQAGEHPVLVQQKAVTAQSEAQLHATERSWVPQFNLEGAAFARGTGTESDGRRLGGTNGLSPTTANYAVGVTVTFAFMDFASIHAREAAQAAAVRANKSNEQLADRTLQERFAIARAAVRTAREVAANTPVEVNAAHTAFDQAQARYKAGLGPIDDVAQAQRLVVQAEIDDSIARLNVWRALLQLQASRGDIQPFVQAVSK
ncbi:MAG: outer rane efflux protein [Edaphobacter sp.]|nr:outer rane efflux protein [Edaphobacter sp.]